MKKLSQSRFVAGIMSAAASYGRLNVSAHAAGACYFLVLAVFPTMVLLIGLVQYTLFGVEEILEMLDGLIPATLMPIVERLARTTFEHSTGALLSGSAIMALWSASRGVYGLQRGLNAMYRVVETRNPVLVQLGSVLYTAIFLVVLLLTLVLHVFGTTILSYLPEATNPVIILVMEVIDFRFFLLLGIQTLAFSVMYWWLPNRKHDFRSGIPGALFASACWLVLSDWFSRYVEFFPRYANIFGSMYAVALALLWLYSCITILYLGGAMNYWLEQRKQNS